MARSIAAAVSKAQTECRSFSALFYQKIPKELRDLVYSYLCVEDRQIPIGPYHHYRKYEPRGKEDGASYSNTQYFPRSGDLHTELSDGKIRIDHDIYPQDDILLPHYHIFNASYVGAEVALEALKTYYQCNSFSVCNIEGGLDDLCTATKYGSSTSDLVPVDHIRDLQIRVKLEHFDAENEAITGDTGARLRRFTEQQCVLRRTIETLQKFRFRMRTTSPQELNLEIVLMSELHDSSIRPGVLSQMHVTNFLQTVRTLVYELLHDHSHATVRVTHQDDGLFTFPKDHTRLFNLTKEQWDFVRTAQSHSRLWSCLTDCHQEKAQQQPHQDWSQHFWLHPVTKGEIFESEMIDLGGYSLDSLDDFVSKRWGVDNILYGRPNSMPLAESPYWPVGRPYNPQAAEALSK